ncbi:MAG TPA: integrase core domain-containing protein [Anaerolineales bacterium]|nr:integrase core domain-containing protein [Anaerolineales bacterium]
MGNILDWLQERVKHWTKPATSVLIIGTLSDLTRSRTDLVVENALLRQQLIVLNRQVKRPQLTNTERFRLVFLSHFTTFWKQALDIVQPDTLLCWHRELFCTYWRKKSQGKPKISAETIALIEKMAKENLLWGAERIRGELLKLGIEVSKRTIQRYMPKDRKEHSLSQNWATFLKNQAGNTWACDFTVVHDWLFRQWHVFVVMELETRRIVHAGVTKFPTDKWTAQQLREATPWGKEPKYLIRDRDSKYATHFSAVAASIKELKTPYRTPQANGVCERFMGSLRRECLDHILIHDDKHLQRVVVEYTAYFNQERPHQGIAQCIPNHYDLSKSKPISGRITSKAILGGLHHSYSRATYLN